MMPPRRSLGPSSGPCRWPGVCDRQATQSGWGCRQHFYRLHPDLRRRLWQAHRDELAASGRTGPAWAVVDNEARAWAAEQLAKPELRASWREPELKL